MPAYGGEHGLPAETRRCIIWYCCCPSAFGEDADPTPHAAAAPPPPPLPAAPAPPPLKLLGVMQRVEPPPSGVCWLLRLPSQGVTSMCARCQAGLLPEPSWLMVTAVSSPRSASSMKNSSMVPLQHAVQFVCWVQPLSGGVSACQHLFVYGVCTCNHLINCIKSTFKTQLAQACLPVKSAGAAKQLVLQSVSQQTMQLQVHVGVCASAPHVRGGNKHLVRDRRPAAACCQHPADAAILILC